MDYDLSGHRRRSCDVADLSRAFWTRAYLRWMSAIPKMDGILKISA